MTFYNDKQPDKHKKYRQKQTQKGLVRFEFQVTKQAKAAFDNIVDAVADEMDTPWDKRQRLAIARRQVFEEITQEVTHDFFALKDQIQALQAQVAALAPSFFKKDHAKPIPIPDAITALPDDPSHLKVLLAKTYAEAQQAKLIAKDYQQKANRYLQLYELALTQNEQYEKQLKSVGLPINEE